MVTEPGHSPPDRPLSASTKTSVQTGSQKWRRGWGRWCWDVRSLEMSAASQSDTPIPKERKQMNHLNQEILCKNLIVFLLECLDVFFLDRVWGFFTKLQQMCINCYTFLFMCSSNLLRASCSPPGKGSSPRAVMSWPRSSSLGIAYSFSWSCDWGVVTSFDE